MPPHFGRRSNESQSPLPDRAYLELGEGRRMEAFLDTRIHGGDFHVGFGEGQGSGEGNSDEAADKRAKSEGIVQSFELRQVSFHQNPTEREGV